MESIPDLDLSTFASGLYGLTAAGAGTLAEAASVTLSALHASPVSMGVRFVGTENTLSITLLTITPAMTNTHADDDEALERSGYCVAIHVLCSRGDYQRVRRAAKKTGVDYWLSASTSSGLTFTGHARLEVSSTRKRSNVSSRISRKATQSKQSDDSSLPCFIAVIDRSGPSARIERRAP